MDRRNFFREFSRSLLSSAVESVDSIRGFIPHSGEDPVTTAPPTWLRPPGALPEPQFVAVCTQCTACQEACPYDSIRRLGPEFGVIAGTPVIIPNESPCYLCEDMPCITSCEPGALLPVAKAEVNMGLAVLNEPACYLVQGQPCDYCVARCPVHGAIRYVDNRLPVIDDKICTGCGVCAYICPAEALSITPTTELQQR